MKPLFEAYQLEELKEAREYLDKAWKCKNAHMVHRPVEFNGQGATFFGLTHDTDSVCAVILPFGEPYLRLVHISNVKPFPAVSEPNLDENKCAKNYDEDGGFGRKG